MWARECSKLHDWRIQTQNKFHQRIFDRNAKLSGILSYLMVEKGWIIQSILSAWYGFQYIACAKIVKSSYQNFPLVVRKKTSFSCIGILEYGNWTVTKVDCVMSKIYHTPSWFSNTDIHSTLISIKKPIVTSIENYLTAKLKSLPTPQIQAYMTGHIY